MAFALDDPFGRAETVAVHSRGGLDLHRIAAQPDRPNQLLIGMGLENRDHAGIATARPHDVERRALALSWQPRSLHLEELAVKYEMCGEPRSSLHMCEHDDTGPVRDEALYSRDELVGGQQRVVDPPAVRLDGAATRDMPRQPDDVFVRATEHQDVDDVGRAGGDHSRQAIKAPTHPCPLRAVVEALDAGPAARLRLPVEERGVVRQGGAIPKKITRDVLPCAGIGQPIHSVSVQRQLQAVRMAVAPALRATFETHVAIAGSQHGKTLALQHHTLGSPRLLRGRKIGQHLEQRPPGQRRARRATGVRGGVGGGRVVQVGLMQSGAGRRRVV